MNMVTAAGGRARRGGAQEYLSGKIKKAKRVWKQLVASILFFGASFARIRERRAGLLLPEGRALVW
jgi:hypothetical protein